MAASIDQQFIEYIVKSLVSHPDAVQIKRTIDEKGVLLELTVDPEDLGRVIGKRGATAQSLRTLLRALGTKNDARYNLKIVDVGGPRPSASSSRSDDDQQEPAALDQTADDAAPVDEDQGSSDVEDEAEPEVVKDNGETSDVVSRTRKELADLDDLDV
ncbi:MAG TPA: KH domain-containing protein [Candidatus Saccharimonadales bacterium]|nr:KH domain-containing protein [Candidatus Saccharimonadales bacterium]